MSHFNSDSSPPAKKRRTEQDSREIGQEVGHPVKSSNFWFEDGNIILQAQNTQFRVYRGIIARHSKVFRDMFEILQPDEALTDGCSVVHVTDAPKEWENLFRIIYDNNAAYKSIDVLELRQLSCMLRLGRKYGFDHLRDEALERIKVTLPNSLDIWEKNSRKGRVNVAAGHEIDLINVLLEMEIRSLLPMAYYNCVQNLSLEAIFQGTSRADGTMARLPPDLIEKLVLGQEKISRAMWEHELGWASSKLPMASFRVSGPCKTHGPIKIASSATGPHVSFAFLPGKDFFVSLGCTTCQNGILETFESGRRHIWEKLPTYFGLPEWGELKDG